MRFGDAVLTLRKLTPIKAFPYFHCVSLKTRCEIRELYSAVHSVLPVRNKKNAAPPFPVRHRLCTLFHHFSFLPPLFVLTFSTLYVLEFPNQFFIFFRARVRQPLRRCHKVYEFRFGAVLYSAELDAG